MALGFAAPGVATPADRPAFGIEPFIHHRDPPFFIALDQAQRERADLGHEVLNTQWVPAGTPHAERRDGVGPLFNAPSCDECHNEGAHGRGPVSDGLAPFSLVVQLEQPAAGPREEPRCDPVYGCVFNPVALRGVRPEGQVAIHYREIVGRYADGTPWTLWAPSYRLVNLGYGSLAPQTIVKPRIAPALFGMGLLEAVPVSAITAGAGADTGGVPAWQWRGGVRMLGRFGWQGSAVSVRDQTARAFAREMGLTSSVIGADDCTASEVACLEQPNGGTPEVSDTLFNAVVDFVSWLAVPAAPEKLAAPQKPAAMEKPAAPQKPAGPGEQEDESALFARLGCAACHRPRLPVVLRGKDGRPIRRSIAPYTDLRLHDLGMALADRNIAGVAVPSKWLTAPLWGLGYRLERESAPTFLHDGRARSVAEAILWHGGEASGARRRFEALDSAQRQALLRWLGTL